MRREDGRGVLISSYEQRITERTHIWMIVSFLYHCLWCVHALGCEAQIVPGDLKPAKAGLPPGEVALPVVRLDEGASADTQPELMAHTARYCYFKQFFLCLLLRATCQYS